MRLLEINRNAEIKTGLDLCRRAHRLHREGKYTDSEETLSVFWQGVGTTPDTKELPTELAAEVLLRAGSLTGVLGSSRGLPGAQQLARDILTQSKTLFDSFGAKGKTGEAQSEIGYCYYRSGQYGEARACINDALGLIDSPDARSLALIRAANVESVSGNPEEAISVLTRNYLLFQRSENEATKAGFHSTLAMAYCHALRFGRSVEMASRAFRECEIALEYYARLNYEHYIVLVKNNMALAATYLDRTDEAHACLDDAESLALAAHKEDWLAQIAETRANVFMREDRYGDAEGAICNSLFLLGQIDQKGLLAESLTTYAIILAHTGRVELAKQKLQEAIQTAESVGDFMGTRRASGELAKIDNLVSMSDARARASQTFLRTAADDSMIGDLIYAGESYEFRHTRRWKDGDIAVADTPQGCFIAHLYHVAPNAVRFSFSNKEYRDRCYLLSEVEILGVIC